MEKQYKKIIFFLVIIYAFLPIYTASASQDLTKNEQFFFDLINMARERPLDVVEALGMDKKKVLDDNPKLRKILKDGLPPLLINNKLQKASARHSLDMLKNSYLSHESLDGRTVQDRIEESGYDALICAERLNMTTFRNFIPSETALLNMFESMFKDELDPTFDGDRCILNPWFKEAGVSLASGKFDIQGKSRNAYIINVDFALSALYKIERELFRLFNGCRANPLVTMQQVDISEDKAKEIVTQNISEEEIKNIPYQAWNDKLEYTSARHALNMEEEQYIDTITANGTSLEYRLNSQGYQATDSAEMIVLYPLSDEELKTRTQLLAKQIFKELILSSAKIKSGLMPLLDSNYTEVGINVRRIKTYPSLGFNAPEAILAVADFAAPKEQSSYIFGHVYKDIDKDGSFDIESEGIPLMHISSTFNATTDSSVISGPLGEYQIKSNAIFERLFLFDSEKTLIDSTMRLNMESEMLDFEVATDN